MITILLFINFFRNSIELKFVDPKHYNNSLQIDLPSGTLQGGVEHTIFKNVIYYKYQGIPYAEPPVEDLRWRPPVPYANWRGVLNATFEGDSCIQMSWEIGSEDCLYINVYTTQKPSSDRSLPVMVWIHGGRFSTGNSSYSIYGPDYLLENGIVFVSFNYRLGIFGFMSTEDLIMPGNYGLKDQVEALRWVNKNIEKFGGDPANVTIFGESSGAACVGYLMLIPQCKGLFNKAISASGSALCPWAFQREPKRLVFLLAHSLAIFESSIAVMVDKLRKEDPQKLRSRLIGINLGTIVDPLNGLPFAPCLEPYHPEAVLTNGSNYLFESGNFHYIPYMIGFTSQEASIIQDSIEVTRPYIAHWDLLPQMLVPNNFNVTKTARKEIALKIRNYYFGKKFISLSSKTKMMNFLEDSQFVRSIRHNVKVCSKFTTIYLYMFSYEGVIGNYWTKKERLRKVRGPGHKEDLFYLFRKSNVSPVNSSDLNMITIMTQLWTNFVKFGNPTPSNSTTLWLPINQNDTTLHYLDIDNPPSLKINPRAESMDFWDDIYKDYGAGNEHDTY